MQTRSLKESVVDRTTPKDVGPDFYYLLEDPRFNLQVAKSIEEIERRVRRRGEQSYKIVWFGGITEFRLFDGKFRRVMPCKEDCLR